MWIQRHSLYILLYPFVFFYCLGIYLWGPEHSKIQEKTWVFQKYKLIFSYLKYEFLVNILISYQRGRREDASLRYIDLILASAIAASSRHELINYVASSVSP